MSESEVMVRPEATAPAELTVTEVQRQISKIQGLMKEVMKDGEHFGVIPGTGKKPSLLKPGAEKINFIFRLEPEYEITRHELPNGHREFCIVCTLKQIGSGVKVGSGVGSCSTMESKYRYRNVADYEILDQPIPKDAKERKAEYRKQGFGMKQIDGVWSWVKYTSTEKADNPDIADVYNTVLKMAKKRAYVDATLTATAASDFFTQDVEDFAEPTQQKTPAPQAAPQQPTPQAEEPTRRVEGQSTTFQPSTTRRQEAPRPAAKASTSMFDDRPIHE